MCLRVISMGAGKLTVQMGFLTPNGQAMRPGGWNLVGRQMRRAE